MCCVAVAGRMAPALFKIVHVCMYVLRTAPLDPASAFRRCAEIGMCNQRGVEFSSSSITARSAVFRPSARQIGPFNYNALRIVHRSKAELHQHEITRGINVFIALVHAAAASVSCVRPWVMRRKECRGRLQIWAHSCRGYARLQQQPRSSLRHSICLHPSTMPQRKAAA